MVFARWLQCAPLPNMCFLDLPESKCQTASRSVQMFLHSSPQGVPILYNGPRLPFNISPSHGGSGPHLIHVPRAHLSPQPKWHLDRFSHFCRAHQCDRQTESQTDRQTEDATRSITIGCTYIRSMCDVASASPIHA